ncbi:MAG: DMT family transporter [Burkholderiales bacterium]|nr:DMT family transporter [Burkholderiales bacterium]
MTGVVHPASVRTTRIAVVCMVVSGIAWGLTWMPLKHFAAQGLGGLMMSMLTYGLVGIVAIPVIWRQFPAWRPEWRQLVGIAILGGLGNACFVSVIAVGEVVRAMLLFYLLPLWSIVGARLFLHERVTPQRAMAIAMTMAGAFCVLGGPAALDAPFAWTDALAVLAGFLYASQNLVSRAAQRIPVLSKTLAVFVGCGLASLIGVVALDQPVPPISGTLGMQLAAFAFIWLLAAMLMSLYGVSHLEAGRVAVLIVLELVAGVISAMLIGHETLNLLGWVGAALITAATMLEARPSNPSVPIAATRISPCPKP